MIAVPAEALAATVPISLGATLRFLSTNSRSGFQPVSWWQSQGLAYENYVGQGRGDYNAACVPINSNWEGPSTRVVLSMRLYCTDSRSRTFRWAITSQRRDFWFLGTGPAPADPALLAQGKWTADVASQRVHWERQSFPVRDLPETFYVYLWRAAPDYGNVHIYEFSAQIYSYSGPTTWWTHRTYVYDEERGWVLSPVWIRAPDAQGQRRWLPAK